MGRDPGALREWGVTRGVEICPHREAEGEEDRSQGNDENNVCRDGVV